MNAEYYRGLRAEQNTIPERYPVVILADGRPQREPRRIAATLIYRHQAQPTPTGAQLVKINSNAQTILQYFELVMKGLTAVLAIHAEVGHATAAQLVSDAIVAGASIGAQVPESHVQLISALAVQLAPTVAAIVQQIQHPPTPLTATAVAGV